MKIALVSLNQVWEDKKENLILCEKYIKAASSEGIELIIFPEMTLTGFSVSIKNIAEENKDSETILNFQKLAEKYNIGILFGVVIRDGEKALNRSVFIDEKGTVLGKYSKIHPFSFSGEDKYFNAGNEMSIIEYKNHNIGLSICYDLRFPELYTGLAKKSDIIVNIANWPKKRVDHWNTLLKARAIENQLFVIGVNRIGKDRNKLEYEESSNAYNANGDKLEYKTLEGMKFFNIDKLFTQKFKDKFITTLDRKVEFYKGII